MHLVGLYYKEYSKFVPFIILIFLHRSQNSKMCSFYYPYIPTPVSKFENLFLLLSSYSYTGLKIRKFVPFLILIFLHRSQNSKICSFYYPHIPTPDSKFVFQDVTTHFI